MAHKQLGYKFEDDWTMDEMKQVLESINSIEVIPVNTEIKADQTVLNFDNVKKYISGARRIAVLDCDCRTKRKHCDAPLDVCIVLDSNADSILTSEKYLQLHPREVNVDEALNILKRFNEAGLVHMAYLTENKEKVETICSCCSCCCENMGAILRYGLAPHLLKASAKTTTDMSKCTGCGVCIERCHSGAREIVNGELEYNKELCYGCGLCVSTCPTNAISLIQHQ